MINAKANLGDDRSLIVLLCNGDNDAYALLYDRYGAMLYGVILRIVGEHPDAENLLQDTIVKVWRYIDSYDASKARFTTWILNIARNTAIDFTRSKVFLQRKQKQNLESLHDAGNELVSTSGIQSDTIGLRQIVEKLTTSHRQIIDWMYFDGYTQQEIADNFNIPLGTVKTRTRAALTELRRCFA